MDHSVGERVEVDVEVHDHVARVESRAQHGALRDRLTAMAASKRLMRCGVSSSAKDSSDYSPEKPS